MAPGSLVILTRVPRPGACKTRLIPALGPEGAAALSQAFLLDLLERFRAEPLHRVVAWESGPPAGELAPPEYRHLLQGSGDLGERMVRLWRELPSPVVFLGSDAPTLPRSAVASAALALEDYDLVLQPACDGGFTLGGFSVDPADLFREVPWGGSEVLDRVLDHSRAAGLRVALLDPWYDVDVPADLRRLHAHLDYLDSRTTRGPAAPRTSACLSRLLERLP